MVITQFEKAHVEDAAALVHDAYSAERSAVRVLPFHGDYREKFISMVAALADAAEGPAAFAALERGKLIGFLAGYPVERFFSSLGGVYVPLYGHAAAGGDKRLVSQRLYAEASGAWVRDGRLMHAVSMFAHDREDIDAWYWLGFGLRCVDAIRQLSDVDTSNLAGLVIRKASPADAEALYPLHDAHCGYYENPPLFMPHVELESGLADFRHWLAGEGQHLWAAYVDGKPVSYMRVRHGGETFVAEDTATVNIFGAYTIDSARGTGAGTLLLAVVVQWAREQGYKRLGVDYESFNVFGSRFWTKHFTPFMLSATRFIDDRMIKAEAPRTVTIG